MPVLQGQYGVQCTLRVEHICGDLLDLALRTEIALVDRPIVRLQYCGIFEWVSVS